MPPLLLINGYAATAADWDPAFLGGLEAEFELILPDNRGVGGSPLGKGELTIEAMAGDMAALLDRMEIERAAVAGWSMGGFVAQRLAARVPGRVAALALLATDPGGPRSVPAGPEVWARLTDRSGTPREQAGRLISLLFPPALAPRIDREFGDAVAAARAALPPCTLRAQEAAMEAWHREEQDPPAAAPPTLVVHGSEDVVIPPANAELLRSRWDAAGVELIEGGGHAFMAQEPERVARLIAAHAAG